MMDRPSEIEDRRSVRLDQSLRHWCLASNPSSPSTPWRVAAALSAAPQASLKVFYTTSLSSLSFSLLIFGFCSFVVECRLFCFERESSLSFWTDSLSLSLYNYSIYLPLFFFLLYPLVCHCVGQLVLVSLFFSVKFIWLAPLVWILSVEWGR